MKNIFVINGGQKFGHSGGRFNETITSVTENYFQKHPEYTVRVSNVNDLYDPQQEVDNYVWADVVIYHTPIWWFQLPHGFKKYIDVVFTVGHANGIYHNDGRRSANPTRNYGTGGMLQGKKYLVTTSWNAPEEAFTVPGEFFNEKSVDEGPLFGFHRMNAFTGMEPLESKHFHDIEKNADVDRDMKAWRVHLDKLFLSEKAYIKS